ncbi:hypothetical protein RB623_07275 [Mesorhizobium sp. LHD-90]|uniref:hypothetical protein n=1 Tax=Mesorhizobium sp. LHD-90 TaxID=3071414 RepID=UPI0027E212E5|nr:hypothetical protein [Mesorhizobium sp. LHD-90]MDQ6433853.1 hypothetical protein [Mesorhizobium sp. LHD-90]
MVRSLLVVLATLIATDAYAIARFSSNRMSCARVQQSVRDNGAAIVSYTSRRGNPLYDRFVRSAQFCQGGEVTEIVYITAADTQSCPVLRCEEFEPPFNMR